MTNFTRTPLVWLYMQSHYRDVAEPAPAVYALVRDEERSAQVHRQSWNLGLAERSIGVTGKSQVIDLGPLSWPQQADFVKLRLTLHYSPFWKVRKPSQIAVEVELADGSRKRTQVIAPPNTPCDIWVYPWKEEDLADYLDADAANWRKHAGPPVVRVRIIFERNDWFAMMPDRVTVEGGESVALVQ